MTTETDTLDRTEAWINDGGLRHVPWFETQKLVLDLRTAVTRLRQRISELEYRERSRECVGGKTQEHWRVKGLEADLNSALDVLWRRGDPGSRYWVRWNYPAFAAHRDKCAELRERAQHVGDAVVGSDTIETPNWTNLSDLPADRPDAVQILRERASDKSREGHEAHETGKSLHVVHLQYVISEAVREVADALEKERKGMSDRDGTKTEHERADAEERAALIKQGKEIADALEKRWIDQFLRCRPEGESK